ncbi:MAG: GtrA family protein [Anaerolineae bacterium]|nr:GtrA family protein [Anaerolineae bacterium]MCO5198883.1 GtrA family protein [Anaerolineae bacterium]MCO5206087.1 GtrA family protein [Anaerolineae bacterium]
MAMITTVATRVGVNPKELTRFLKFLVVGVIGAVVDFGTYNLLIGPLSRSDVPANVIAWFEPVATLTPEQVVAIIAGTISFVLAVISNFIWNRYWTYPDSRSKSLPRQFAQFFLVNISAIFIRLPILALTVNFFSRTAATLFPSLSDPVAVRLGKNLALALAVGIALFWNFFINRYWTYSDVD